MTFIEALEELRSHLQRYVDLDEADLDRPFVLNTHLYKSSKELLEKLYEEIRLDLV